jgi:steroid 5-alpha reductase family enzyme
MLSPWLVAAAVIAACMAATFALALRLRDNSIVDVTYGLAFVLATGATFALSPTRHPRETLLLVLVAVWGVRLAAHLLVRKWYQGEDFRYRAWRESWGRWFVLRSVLQIYALQGVVILVVLTPVLLVRRAPGGPLGWLDLAGLAVWVVGFLFEAIGDRQLLVFKRDPGNRGRFIRHGLWRYTRHPNYFGEATLWWGVFLVGLSAGSGALGVVSPLAINLLLLFVSGIPMLEKKWAGDPELEAYRRQTSPFFPWFPKVERR